MTAAQANETSSTTVTASGNKLQLNGKPFFAILALIRQCPDPSKPESNFIPADVAMGVNVFDALPCAPFGFPGDQPYSPVDKMLNGQAWWRDKAAAHDPNPEVHHFSELLDWKAPLLIRQDWEPYGLCGQPNTDSLAPAYNYIRLRSASKPFAYQIYLADKSLPNRQFCLTATQLKAVFMASVAAGATGVEYETMYPWDSLSGVHVDAPLSAMAKILAGRMKVLWPILGQGVRQELKAQPSSTVKGGIWKQGRSYIVVAVNTDAVKPANATFKLPAGIGAKAQVLWEGRSASVHDATLVDKFAPLGVHVYKLGSK